MNERALELLARLFAQVAVQDGLVQQEADLVRRYLKQQLPNEAANRLYEIFLDEVRVGGSDLQETCRAINQELERTQKMVFLLQLAELVVADGHLSAQERNKLKTIHQALNLPADALRNFLHMVRAEGMPRENWKNLPTLNQWLWLTNEERQLDIPVSLPQHLVEQWGGVVLALHVPSTNQLFIRILEGENISLNGQLLTPNRVYQLPKGSVLRSPNARPVSYSEIQNHFWLRHRTDDITFEARDISFRFPDGSWGVRNLSLREHSGCLVAIMGASGAGKSTLLQVLNGLYKPETGSIRINGRELYTQDDTTEGLIGFVPQEDLLIARLTVYQNLYYSARLVYGDWSAEQLHEKVRETLLAVGLWNRRDQLVGDVLSQTLSGGQRKRLNIALELLREPPILFVDEPTSGLSSGDSQLVMDLLHELSLGNKLVFVVIHQPNSDLYRQFDRLLLLDKGGHLIYAGSPLDAISYFKEAYGYPQPDVVACTECGTVSPELIFQVVEAEVLDQEGQPSGMRRRSPREWAERFLRLRGTAASPATGKHDENAPLPNRQGSPPNPLRQTWVFFVRDLRAKLGNRAYWLLNLGSAPLLALLLAFTLRYYDPQGEPGGYTLLQNRNLPVYLFTSIIVALFLGLIGSVEELIRDRGLRRREYFLHLSTGAYLTAKLGVLLLVAAIQSALYVAMGSSLLEIRELWLWHWGILFLTTAVAALIGLNISAVINSEVVGYILAPIILIPHLLLSGSLLQYEHLNPTIQSRDRSPSIFGEVLISRWAYEALAVAQFRYNAYERTLFPSEVQISQARYRLNYWIPKIRAELHWLDAHQHQAQYSTKARATHNLLTNEFDKLAVQLGGDWRNRLAPPQHWKAPTLARLESTLDELQAHYRYQLAQAQRTHDQVLQSLHQRYGSVRELKQKHDNQALRDRLTNVQASQRMERLDNRLIQHMDPIYQPAYRQSWSLFPAQHFYSPSKLWFGRAVATPVYFLWVALLYGGLLFLALRLNLLKRLLQGVQTILSRSTQLLRLSVRLLRLQWLRKLRRN